MIIQKKTSYVEQSRDIVQRGGGYVLNPNNETPHRIKVALDLAYDEKDAPKIDALLEALQLLMVDENGEPYPLDEVVVPRDERCQCGLVSQLMGTPHERVCPMYGRG